MIEVIQVMQIAKSTKKQFLSCVSICTKLMAGEEAAANECCFLFSCLTASGLIDVIWSIILNLDPALIMDWYGSDISDNTYRILMVLNFMIRYW